MFLGEAKAVTENGVKNTDPETIEIDSDKVCS